MCHRDICHYKCGHAYEGKVRRCQSYYEMRAEETPTLCMIFRRKTMDCKDLMSVNQDIATVCSVTCAKRLLNTQKSRENELRQREKQLKEREMASAREYEQNKKAEEEALRRQRVERVERARRERENGRHTQGAPAQQRMPFQPTTSRAGNSISRSNARHLGPGQTGALDDPRVRVQASRQHAQSVARRNPTLPATKQRPKVEPFYAPPVPPKDTSWRPQHPNMVPAPLTVGTRTPTRTTGPPPTTTTTAPKRKPVYPNNNNNSSSSRSSAPAAQTRPAGPINPTHHINPMHQLSPTHKVNQTYRPSPMHRPNPGHNKPCPAVPVPNRLVKNNPAPSSSSSGGRRLVVTRAGADSSKTRSAPAAGVTPTGGPVKKKSWLKKLVGGAGSCESAEWVSADAVRVERGSVVGL
ncbi:uncharacterized protein B0H64DRAFT_430063 [Chaetomium fimeti]|uniref:Uncharacterized protein n=1 Tax=Chaetomium fimeti TaxID=1854472 RepID=A0AAE0LVD9_9PEZI|nr:hypothetical protein B0H64DRAFT_430063 [Chaetomium fimeti]